RYTPLFRSRRHLAPHLGPQPPPQRPPGAPGRRHHPHPHPPRHRPGGSVTYTALAADALARLRTALPELRRQLAATTRPTAHGWTWLDETARDRRDAQIRAERAERGTLARLGRARTGGGLDPLNLTVLDAIRDIELVLAELETAVCERVAPGLAPSPTADARLDRLDDLLGKVAADYD